MARLPKFEVIQTPKGHCVSIPAGLDSKGQRRRRYFSDPAAAARFAASLRGQYARGERGGVIPVSLAMQAAAAAERIPAGHSLASVVEEWAAATQALRGTGISLLSAATAAAARHRADASGETLQARWLRFQLENEAHWSPRYRADMAKLPRWVGPALMATPCRDISPQAIRSALAANGAKSATTLRARGARVAAALQAREKARRVSSDISILSFAQAAALLRAAETPAQRRCIALLLFAGIRPDSEFGEIARLDWSAVSPAEIYVSTAVAKTNSDRIIPITPRLARLIAGHPTAGPVRPPQWKRAWARIRAAVGIASMQDVTRHTYASHHLAAFGEDATLAAMGHTAGARTLFRHYRRAIARETGLRYFAAGRPANQSSTASA
jgi:hypothetical protein